MDIFNPISFQLIIIMKNQIPFFACLIGMMCYCQTGFETDEQLTLSNNILRPPTELEILAPDVISTSLYERDIAISADGQMLVYTLGDYKQTIRNLVMISLQEGSGSEMTMLPFNSSHHDIEPFFSTDGSRLYFASNRPIGGDTSRFDYNIWYVEVNDGDWSVPVPMPEEINSLGDEFYPAVSSSKTIYFTASRPDGIGREDIFLSKWIEGNYQDPELLDSMINTEFYEFNAYISPDEDLLIFSSFGRPDDIGGGDLYISQRNEEGQWIAARNLGQSVNSPALDYCPFVDLESGTFYFTSERSNGTDLSPINSIEEMRNYAARIQNGFGNIYFAPIEFLGL